MPFCYYTCIQYSSSKTRRSLKFKNERNFETVSKIVPSILLNRGFCLKLVCEISLNSIKAFDLNCGQLQMLTNHNSEARLLNTVLNT